MMNLGMSRGGGRKCSNLKEIPLLRFQWQEIESAKPQNKYFVVSKKRNCFVLPSNLNFTEDTSPPHSFPHEMCYLANGASSIFYLFNIDKVLGHVLFN